MICKQCGRFSPADPETGYDADDLCPDCRAIEERLQQGEKLLYVIPTERMTWESTHCPYCNLNMRDLKPGENRIGHLTGQCKPKPTHELVIYFEQLGGHTHLKVFAGRFHTSQSGWPHGLAGDLTLTNDEFAAWKNAKLAVEFKAKQ